MENHQASCPLLLYFISAALFRLFQPNFCHISTYHIPLNVTTSSMLMVESQHRYLFCSLEEYSLIIISMLIEIKKRLQLDIYSIFIRNQAEPLHMIDIK